MTISLNKLLVLLALTLLLLVTLGQQVAAASGAAAPLAQGATPRLILKHRPRPGP